MINQLRKLFDWKANPASVFIIAIPLAGIGLGTGFLVALLHWLAGDPVYMFIFFGILAISLPTFWSLYKLHRTLNG